jgi:hypothetical protein
MRFNIRLENADGSFTDTSAPGDTIKEAWAYVEGEHLSNSIRWRGAIGFVDRDIPCSLSDVSWSTRHKLPRSRPA